MRFWLMFALALPSLASLETAPASADSTDPATEIQPSDLAETGTLVALNPLPTTPVPAQLGGLLVFPGAVITLVLLLLISIWAYTRVYVITPNNEAFVRTGGVFVKRKTVVLNGGCVVLPGFHELTRVPLREISIDVERTGKLAVRTQDYLRADMRVTLYVCISASEEDVLTSAARLSKEGKISPDDIKNALEKRADDGIRAAAKTKTLAEIDSDKLGFAQEVLNLIEPDLKKVGLTLNNIAISEIEESDTYDTNNFFDAQGVRLRTETIQRSIQQKREVELATKVAIEQKELDAEKRSLQIAQEKEDANLAQQFELESLKAQRQREIQESKDREAAAAQRTKISQEQSVEEEEISRQLSVQQKQIEADIELEERQKNLQVAQATQRQESEVAEVNRRKAVDVANFRAAIELAESERESQVAQQEAAIAIAEKERERFTAEALRAQAEAAVQTAQAVETAEREQRLSEIAAEQAAAERRIADQNVVEIDVFRKRRQAEIARQTAELEAEAIRTLAAAELDRALAEAQGEEAKVTAKNAISSAVLTSEVIAQIWPDLAVQLPEVLAALAPQPGVIGDARIYSFPGAGQGADGPGDINKLLLSTSGLALINSLLDEGRLGQLAGQVRQLLQGDSPSPATTAPDTNTDPAPESDS